MTTIYSTLPPLSATSTVTNTLASPIPTPSHPKGSGLSRSANLGIVFGIIAIILVIGFFLVLIHLSQRRRYVNAQNAGAMSRETVQSTFAGGKKHVSFGETNMREAIGMNEDLNHSMAVLSQSLWMKCTKRRLRFATMGLMSLKARDELMVTVRLGLTPREIMINEFIVSNLFSKDGLCTYLQVANK